MCLNNCLSTNVRKRSETVIPTWTTAVPCTVSLYVYLFDALLLITRGANYQWSGGQLASPLAFERVPDLLQRHQIATAGPKSRHRRKCFALPYEALALTEMSGCMVISLKYRCSNLVVSSFGPKHWAEKVAFYKATPAVIFTKVPKDIVRRIVKRAVKVEIKMLIMLPWFDSERTGMERMDAFVHAISLTFCI